jgi:fluoride exporter
MFATLIQVAAGGALGASARYLTWVGATRLFGLGFPWGTLIVNVVGSFLMGVLIVMLAERDAMRFAPFLTVGLLGGFTTFSAFSLDAVTLVERGQVGAAAGYVGASVAVSITALMLGLWIARGAI